MGIDNIEELIDLPPAKKAKKKAQDPPEDVRERDLADDEEGDDLPKDLENLVTEDVSKIEPDEVDKQHIDPQRMT